MKKPNMYDLEGVKKFFRRKTPEVEYIKVTVYNRCEDCYYWKLDEDESLMVDVLGRGGLSPIMKMGVCECMEVSDFIWYRGHGSDEVEEDLITHESFGCRSWSKEKPY